MITMGQELTRILAERRASDGGTTCGLEYLGKSADEHIVCANMYLVALDRIIKLEDQVSAHETELITMVRLAASEGRAPRSLEEALDKLLAVGQMAMGLLEKYHVGGK